MNHRNEPSHTRIPAALTTAGAALLLTLAAGQALAQSQNPAPNTPTAATHGSLPGANGEPVALNAAQQQSLRQAFNWANRDGTILRSVIVPRQQFIGTAGLKERSGYLNVKVKDRAQMLTQLGAEAQHTPGGTQTRAVDEPNAQADAQARFDAQLASAQARMVEARNRLAPSLREAYDDIDMHSVRIPDGVSAEVAAEALMRTGDYEFVSMDWLCYPADTTPNDPQFGLQWYHAANRIDTVSAWDFTQGDSSTIIAVCDSGVDIDHPDLAAALVPGYNATENLPQVDGGSVNDSLNGHGTLVAGAAAAIGNNNTGISGIGWDFSIMPIRVSNLSNGTALLSNILEGARWASDNGAYSINCSFGGAEDSATRTSGGHIRLEGHLLVFAAGNDGLANQTNDWEKVTIVGASNQADNWVSWSHTGVGIDCIAPGVNIRSTTRTGGYTYTTGTSFSAPITAGALALVHDANPALTADEVEFILLNACDDFMTPGEDNQTGWGRINVGQAVSDAINGPSITALPFEETFPGPDLPLQWRNPVGDVIVSDDAVNPPSGSYALNLDANDSIETIEMRAGVLLGETGEIRFWTQHRGVDAGETLEIEYLGLVGWATLDTIESDGTNQSDFILRRYVMPGLAAFDGTKLRFTAHTSDGGDDWYIDDVIVRAFEGNTLPWEDSFENGITETLDWTQSDATATDDAANEPDGAFSALLTGQGSMTSAEVAIADTPSAVYMRFYTQHQGVENDESLLVEYKTATGLWNELTTIESDGVDQSQFQLHQIALPVAGYGANTALRFTADGDEADDAWYIDAVAITNDLIVEDPCPADINGDGMVNFFDVSAFLTAYNNQQPDGDFNNDGLFNFFDVSGYLAAFSAGCP
ncbi:MAG: S8 family serine peptidase [Phycisphaerales bacterium]